MRLSLLEHFRLVERAQEIVLPQGSQRLVALLALRGLGVRRDLVAGLFWPRVPEACAHRCLRQALHRLARQAPSAVHICEHELSLANSVAVDLYQGRQLATRLIQPHRSGLDLDEVFASIPLLSSDLLPGWYDQWLVEEQGRWRQRRLHALESLANALREHRRFGEASVAAATAIIGDPLRESSRAAMIRIHLSEGNCSEAVREFQRYRALVRRELRREPSAHLRRLLPSI